MPIHKRFQFENVEGARVGRLKAAINTTFILYRMGDTLIDAGPSNQWKPVKEFVTEKPVRQLLLTHHHEDHAGNADRIAKLYDITPFAPTEALDKLKNGYKTPLIQRFMWGSPLPVETQPLPDMVELSDGIKLYPVHTPGHAKDLHCFHLPEKGWLFSGDLYISKSVRYMRSDENLQIHIDSIRKALALDFNVLFCPHRGIVEEGKQAMTEKLANVLELCASAQDLHAQGQPLGQIVKTILGPEDMLSRSTRYNISKRNLISESLKVNLIN